MPVVRLRTCGKSSGFGWHISKRWFVKFVKGNFVHKSKTINFAVPKYDRKNFVEKSIHVEWSYGDCLLLMLRFLETLIYIAKPIY